MGVEVKFNETGLRGHAGSCAECRRSGVRLPTTLSWQMKRTNSPLTYTRARKSCLPKDALGANSSGKSCWDQHSPLDRRLWLTHSLYFAEKYPTSNGLKHCCCSSFCIVVGFLLKLRLIFLLSGILAEKIKRYYNFQPGERRRKQEKSNNPNSVSGREGIATTTAAATSCGK